MLTVKCDKCGATGTARGSYDHDTGTTEITDDPEWSSDEYMPTTCGHDEFTVVDEYDPFEYDQDEWHD